MLGVLVEARTVNGRPLADATIGDVGKAIELAGCSSTRLDSPASPPSKKAVFDAKCGARSFTITFIERGGTMPDSAALEAASARTAVLHREGVLLSVEPGQGADLSQARALLAKIAPQP